MECWRSYYAGLFNRLNAPNSEELTTAPQSAIEDPTINCSEPTTKEVINCLNKMKNGKERESIPVKFRTSAEEAVTLQAGRKYTAPAAHSSQTTAATSPLLR